jgi:hypothetical protein
MQNASSTRSDRAVYLLGVPGFVGAESRPLQPAEYGAGERSV